MSSGWLVGGRAYHPDMGKVRWWAVVGALVVLGVVVVLLWVTGSFGAVYAWLTRYMRPEVWSAIAAWATFGAAIGALIYASHQVREARITRQAQAQPYVVMYMEHNTHVWQVIELVLKNFGATGAKNINIDFDQQPQTLQTKEPPLELSVLNYPTALPFLAPGQEWRTVWDDATDRTSWIENGNTLISKYRATITYQDSEGKDLPASECDLDWSTFEITKHQRVRTVHHLTKLLEEDLGVIRVALSQIATAGLEPKPPPSEATLAKAQVGGATDDISDLGPPEDTPTDQVDEASRQSASGKSDVDR